KWVVSTLDVIGRLAQPEFNVLGTRPSTCHIECTCSQLVQVYRFGGISYSGSRPLREASQNGDCVIGGGLGGLNGVALNWMQAVGVDLLEVSNRGRQVIAEVGHDAFDGSTLEEVAIGIGKLGFKDPPHPPSGDRICERHAERKDDGRQEISDHRSVK